jgi:hypothetical protein
MKRRSLKHHLMVGDLIRTPDRQIYKVIDKQDKHFVCFNITDTEEFGTYKQEFYYNIEMMIYRRYTDNYDPEL